MSAAFLPTKLNCRASSSRGNLWKAKTSSVACCEVTCSTKCRNSTRARKSFEIEVANGFSSILQCLHEIGLTTRLQIGTENATDVCRNGSPSARPLPHAGPIGQDARRR